MIFLEHFTPQGQNTDSFQAHILGHKRYFHTFQKIQIIGSVFSNYTSISLEISNRKISRKYPNVWKLNNILLNHYESEEIKGNLEKYF